MYLKKMVIIFSLVFWPTSLVLTNDHEPVNLLTFIAPVILIALAYKFYKCDSWAFVISIILIPLVSPKLALYPLVFALIYSLVVKFTKKSLVFLVLSILVLLLSFSHFFGQTIFVSDYEAKQAVIRSQQLYPTPLTARIFHNKGKIYVDKYINNAFELIEPNGYLFEYAPRQIIERNQNLKKYPLLALPFFLLGLYYLKKSKDKSFIIISFVSGVIALSVLSLYDKNDFILYIPLSLLLLHGVNIFDKKYKWASGYYVIFVIISMIELVRIFIQYT